MVVHAAAASRVKVIEVGIDVGASVIASLDGPALAKLKLVLVGGTAVASAVAALLGRRPREEAANREPVR